MIKTSSAYKRAKADADEKYQRHGAYKSMFIVRRYKELGGKFTTRKPPQDSDGLKRWIAEKWKTQDGKPCGSGTHMSKGKKPKNIKVCRPTVRVNKNTPKTWKELQKAGVTRNTAVAKKKTTPKRATYVK